MKRAWLGIALALCLAGIASADGIDRRAVPGVSSNIGAQYPWSGTVAVTIDDSPRWAIYNGAFASMDSILKRVAADSGLTGTAWDLHMTAFSSIAGLNGMKGWHGQDGTNGCGGGGLDTCRYTAAEAKALIATGRWEIGSHAYQHDTLAPSLGSTNRPNSLRSLSPFGGTPDTTIEQDIKAGYACLVDSMGIRPVLSMGAPNHVAYGQAQGMIARYFVNFRGGALLFPTPTGDSRWPTNANRLLASAMTTPLQQGGLMGFNNSSVDVPFYWMNDYNEYAKLMWGPSFAGDRLCIVNELLPNVTGGADSTVLWSKWVGALAAERKATVVLVWHRQGEGNAIGPAPNYGGAAGVEAVVRFWAGLARNGLLQREGPKLQVATLNDAMNKRLTYSFMGGPVNVIDNPKMDWTLSCTREDSTRIVRPWGYSRRMEKCHADSGWFYHSPQEVMATGGWFSPNANDGATMTLIDSVTTAGVFACTKPRADSLSKTWIEYFPVPSNSHIRVWLDAAISETDSLGTWISNSGASATVDSLSSDWVEIKVTPFAWSQVSSDTTAAFERTVGFSATSMALPKTETGWVTYTNRNYAIGTGLVASTGRTFSSARNRGGFHMTDGWIYQASTGWNGVYFQSPGVTGDATHRRTQKWKQFTTLAYVPPEYTMVQVAVLFHGPWHAAGGSVTDSLMFSGLEIQASGH